jgi:hypothetical protein
MPDTAVIAIPARLSSQRLPRKMLLADTGKALIEPGGPARWSWSPTARISPRPFAASAAWR